MQLTDNDLAIYRERGYWISPVLYSNEEIAKLRNAVKDVCLGRREPGCRYWLGSGPEDLDPQNPRVIQVNNAWWVNRRMREAVLDPRLGYIGAQFTNTDEVRLWHDQAIY